MGETRYKGQRFGRLIVIGSHRERQTSYLDCVCDCGNTKSIQSHAVLHGKVKSCGCMNAERSVDPIYKHRLYATWSGMRQRCLNARASAYKNYGGRGIKICAEWVDDFRAFEKWAYENGFKEGLTIDRIDNDGDYEPSNCRWVTISQQNANQRKRIPPRRYEVNGVKKTQKEWCEEYGIHCATVRYRIREMGMSFEEALKMPKVCEGNHSPVLIQRRKRGQR